MSKSELQVSEHFYSLQGEGKTAGRPAVFWRMTGCVLHCSFCDTTEVWKKGIKYSFEDWNQICHRNGYYDKLANGHGARLVITGGDPMIQQESLANYFAFMEEREMPHHPGSWEIEVETQGTIAPISVFREYVTQWNISPKLANSGEPLSKRIKLHILKQYTHIGVANYQFKFVIGSDEDVEEALSLARQCDVPLHRLVFMPMASTREQLHKVGPLVAAAAIKHKVHYSSRLQVELWDKTTGV